MEILITGVAGFLGSSIAESYLLNKHKVCGIDNFSSSDPSSAHLASLKNDRRFRFHKLDVCDLSPTSFDGARFDLIFNMACPASPPIYQRMPVETMMTCTIGVKNVLELAGDHGSKIVHASTSEVYGDPSETPQRESYRGNVNTWGDRACYDEGKRLAETLCYEYLKSHVDVRVARIFNTYGSCMDPRDGRVVSNFLRQAGNDEDITIFGDGKQTRSFCYVDDLVGALTKLAELDANPKTPINIGNPEDFSVEYLANLVIEMFPLTKSRVIYEPLPSDDPKIRKPDIRRAENLLGWSPQTSLKKGLKSMAWNWYQRGIIENRPLV